MFAGHYFPASYFPPNYFPPTGAEVRGGGPFAAGLRHLLQQMAAEDYQRQDRYHQRVRLAREAAARLSFELALLRLRNLEEEARRQLQVQRAVVATVLAEV